MAVGTGNITLQDVTTEIYGDTALGRNLSTSFTDATGTFDATYEGSKDRLSNFKGYIHSVLVANLTSFRMKLGSVLTSPCAFNDGTRTTRYHTGTGATPVIGDYVYSADDYPHNGGGYWWYLGEVTEQDDTIKISTTGEVLDVETCPL